MPYRLVNGAPLPAPSADGAEANDAPVYTPEFPQGLVDSPDWRIRMHLVRNDEGVWVMPQDSEEFRRRVGKVVFTRLRILRPWGQPIPASWGCDMGFIRFPRENSYVHRLRHDEISAIVRDTTAPVTAQLLFSHTARLEPSRHDSSSAMAKELLTFERKQRHRLGVLVPAHCQEAAIMTKAAAAGRFPSCPEWWAAVEDPYGGRTELPPIISYWGIEMMRDMTHPAWKVFRTEWAANKLVELMLRARAGHLYWCSPTSISDIHEVGVDNILGGSPEYVRRDARALLEAITLINWGRVPSENRNVPDVTGEYTPVYEGGDFVAWDASSWEALIPHDWWFEEGESGDHLTCRGVRLRGVLNDSIGGRRSTLGVRAPRRRDNRGSGLLRAMLEEDPEFGSALRRAVKSESPTLKDVLQWIRPKLMALGAPGLESASGVTSEAGNAAVSASLAATSTDAPVNMPAPVSAPSAGSAGTAVPSTTAVRSAAAETPANAAGVEGVVPRTAAGTGQARASSSTDQAEEVDEVEMETGSEA